MRTKLYAAIVRIARNGCAVGTKSSSLRRVNKLSVKVSAPRIVYQSIGVIRITSQLAHPLTDTGWYFSSLIDDLSVLFDHGPDAGTPDGERMEVLLALVSAYEDKHFQIPPPDPIEAIKFRMAAQGLGIPATSLIGHSEKERDLREEAHA